ncbi:probable Glycylpeptide N-tetradecanoyltransferase [Melanopsichium pennsylvanicum]|uniref:Glycylpeptide N-tetradecanoyltransferase n=2 Tax=Melanopsichium pennsylvanicum TaxID=63383 RepID=A0AAJ5C5C0_9BASI|nr:related to NMT1-N-myristoyltransferase [Melanopsichium pennsylvanicum 4]SNX84374.1 probable Glycylpeptide N-tetradecanoyltransferase [Melanopsichium pennsylvanicum]
MSGVADASKAACSTASGSSSSSYSSSATPALARVAPAASLRQPTANIAHDDGSDDEEEEEDDDAENASAATGQDGLTSKQRKKKKSKAAAKLRKKLGLAPSSSSDPSLSSSDGKLLASGNSQSGKITDQVVTQVQQAVAAEHGSTAAASVTKANLAKVMAMMNMERDAMLKSQETKAKAHKQIADHKFWKTQPVMKPNDAPVLKSTQEGSIEQSVAPQQVRQEPYPLPSDFKWVQIDVDNQAELKEVYDLLSANYVEDDDATFRFDYSPEFLHWVLKHPGYHKTWHIGVRVVSTNKLVAFISGIPHELRVREKAYQSTEINFLCVHKKLRSKRLAPVLIKEVTRQCHLTGVFHAIYTVGSVLPTPVSCARYYHRTINAEKLAEIGFSAIPHNMSMETHVKRFELPAKTNLPGLREMQYQDVPAVGKLMRRYMRRFDMAPRFTDEEVQHILLSGRGIQGTKVRGENRRQGQVTWTYVVEDREGKITDMFAFYSLPSSILDHDKHKSLNAAYLFYYATDVVFSSSSTLNSSATTIIDNSSASGGVDVSTSTSASGSTSERALALASGKAPWQVNHLTNCTPVELCDEDFVTSWDSESALIKSELKVRLNLLINTLLIVARDHKFDVVNCVTVMDNALFLQEQKFGPGDGFLRFYLFNWRTKPVSGGMGSRPGEAELDPVHSYAKYLATKQAKSKRTDDDGDDDGERGLAQDLITKAIENPAQVGSGNGVVMV